MKNLVLGTVAVLGLAAASVGGSIALNRTVDYAVGIDAERKAESWSKYLAESISGLDLLVKTGNLNQTQRHQIEIATQAGDVFLFELFDGNGRLVLESDEISGAVGAAARAEADPEADVVEVLRTGKKDTTLHEGRGEVGRRDVYAESLVPVYGADGAIYAVVEVYLDQTEVSQLFHRAFNTLAIVLALVFATAFGGPFIAFLVKNHQELRSTKRANFLAKFDELTNVLNRSGLTAELDRLSKRSADDMVKTATIFADIDHFKTINDTYGHKTGDAFLQHVAECISANLAERDFAGRLGGDEFVIVAQRDTLAEVNTLVEKISAAVSKPIRLQGATQIGHISVGIHYDDQPAQTFETRMRKADVALYQAKLDGRNTYRLFSDDLETKLARRKLVEEAIIGGVEDQRFELHFQPLLDQRSMTCSGFEALLRLRDNNGQSIGPIEFIPVAEEMGEINRIGQWVLERAARAAVDWPAHLFVAVNLSARQFEDGLLVSHVRHVLAETGLDPTRLELELTESVLIENTDSVASQLGELRQLGVKIAMDDFGTGYSSMAYLWRFKFDKLKIDRSFMEGVLTDEPKAREILSAIVMLGHRLNMSVTAEGIETSGQASLLSELDCDHFQGFLYGRPMPAVDLAAYLLAGKPAQTLELSSAAGTAIFQQKAIAI